ncbi:MAG: phosphotransferase, partial [Gaiellaceae bacterium]
MTDLLEERDVGTFEISPGADLAPGSNVKGAVGAANWCFLLPSLELGRIVCLGSPSPAALTTLARLGDEVAVSASGRGLKRLRDALGRLPASVLLLESERSGAVPLPDGSADLVVLARPRGLGLTLGGRLEREAARLLAPDGLLYRETRFFRPAGAAARLWLAPATGEMRAATPLGDRQAIAFLEASFGNRALFQRQLLRRPGRLLGRHRVVSQAVRREGALVGRSRERLAAGPPRYLRSVAAEGGLDVNDSRWALLARGDYPSQKVLFFLFPPAGARPHALVKITREPRFNPRLENEWRALTLLHERGLGTDGTLPRPLFFGVHGGLGVLGESAIEGERFRRRTLGTADCPQARAAVEWLLDLGAATASRAGPDARIVAGLRPLLEQFEEIYRPAGHEGDFLRAQVSKLARGLGGLPLVFQHGDPGPWNVLVTREGRPAFLDWEAAEPEGMPLWDLFHFLRSYSFMVSRAAGTRDALASFSEQWLAESPFNRLLVETTRRFCTQTGLAAGLVEPLFYLCWMHRARKEAATLPPSRLQNGRYVNILRLAVERRGSPGLRRL